MNEHDLAGLSYRDLQALAARYRVPGNIKKHLLVRVLQAIRSGDKSEVDRMLIEVDQTRKKRVKKPKPDKMDVSSTPIHSPNYALSNDCYYSRHQQPYQWVGAEEEVAVREESSMRVPNYEEFQQFLLHRIHRERDYPSYNLSGSGVNPSIVDLRMGAGTSIPRPIYVDTNNTETNITLNPSTYVRPCRDVELHILEDKSSNNQPVLLKKMLEAPVGANLCDIASPDASSHKIWSMEQHQNNSSNPLDADSDTLTADSDNDCNETWNNNNNNDNIPTNYYSAMNNNENNQLYNHNTVPTNRSTQNTHQLQNNFTHDGNYQFVYPAVDDAQANCQKWIATNRFADRDTNYAEMFENSRARTVFYENPLGNSTITKTMNRERKFPYNGSNVHYDENTNVHGQRSGWSNEHHQYYHQTNVASNASNNPHETYPSQQIARIEVGAMQEYFGQGHQSNNNNNAHTEQTIVQSGPAQFGGNVYNNKEIVQNFHQHHEMQYNGGFYQQYSHENNQTMAGFSNQGHHQHQQQQEQTSVVAHESNDRKNVLEKFWPRWPINATITSGGQLETILYLHNHARFDYSKIKQTSCVYCCTEPVVTQSTQASHSSCTEKRLIAEERKHLFTPNCLLYNDASTGMQMANNEESSSDIVDIQEPSNDEPSTERVDEISKHRESTESSENSINDVWIHDYSSYPATADNSLQRVDITNDDNDDDLFSNVRTTSQTSMDDHIIETFTHMNY